MSKITLKTLSSYEYTTTQKLFGVVDNSNAIHHYIANVEKYDDVFDIKLCSNRYSLSSSDGMIIHPLYELSTTLFHSLGARRHRYPYTRKDDYQHIYYALKDNTVSCPEYLGTEFMSTTKAGDAIYGLIPKNTNGHYFVNDEMYSWLNQDNGYAFPKSIEPTLILYNKNTIDRLLNGEVLSVAANDVVLSVIHKFEKNTLVEIPGGIYDDYSKGSIFATTLQCKNQYNSLYSMEQKESNQQFTHLRNYLGVYSCNNIVYLKYIDNLSASYSLYNANLPLHLSANTGNLTVDPISTIPQIEVIENINRGVSPKNHKSTLYSLKVRTPKFETAVVPNILVDDNKVVKQEKIRQATNIRENIRQEIKNIVRVFAERLSPANSLLFSVTVNDK